jgi:hypothetical protein
VKYFIGENDRIKLLVLLCGEEDELLIKAALGTLAVLSSLQADLEYIKDLNFEDNERQRLNDLIKENRIICEKILEVCPLAKSIKIIEIFVFSFYRLNHLLKYLNNYVLVIILIYNFEHFILFEI